ncbi:MAG TPA: hypothetical protein VFZ65_09710, partial [Planctomycetota bacterium]|nr:hypothetical protein [Planctomycetota bacterium]
MTILTRSRGMDAAVHLDHLAGERFNNMRNSIETMPRCGRWRRSVNLLTGSAGRRGRRDALRVRLFE